MHDCICLGLQAEEAEEAAKSLRFAATCQMRMGLEQQLQEKVQLSKEEQVITWSSTISWQACKRPAHACLTPAVQAGIRLQRATGAGL